MYACIHNSASPNTNRSPMPVYQLTTSPDLLSDRQSQDVVDEITRIHTTHTGAPALFVNVVFQEIPAGRIFTAGGAVADVVHRRKHP